MIDDVLPSARNRSAAANLKALVEEARRCGGFGADLPFDDMVWPMPENRGRHGSMNTVQNIYFTRHLANAKRVHHSKRAEVDRPLEQPFRDFLKAYVRLEEVANPHVMLADYGNMIRAGRLLHDVLENKGYDPCLLVDGDFHAAMRVFEASTAASTARQGMGSQLARLADFARRHGLTVLPVSYVRPRTSVARRNDRVGAAAAEAEARLPSDEALDALATVASTAAEDRDVLLIRLVELLVCAPWRISEVLALPADCEVEQAAVRDGVAVVGVDGKPVINYGIRYNGAKGFGGDVKWIPTAMVDVARRAIRDIRRITEPARAVAVWMAKHPGRAYLPPSWRGRDPATKLESSDIAEILVGRRDSAFGCNVITRNHIPHEFGETGYRVALIDLEAELISRCSVVKGSGAPVHAHLFLVPDRFFSPTRTPFPATVRFVPNYAVQNFLAGRNLEGRGDGKSVFERYNLRDREGQFLGVTSHQLRHWLNNLAQRNGMSQVDIARWSGRRSVEQNATYDHVSGYELAEMARAKMEAGQMQGPIALVHDRLPPVERKNFLEAQVATAHVTDVGMCVTDWSLAPCHHHGACADCCEHLVDKGNAKQEARARQLLMETQLSLSQAREEMDDGAYGASNWVAHHERMAKGLRGIIAVHEDPKVPLGTLVQSNPTGALRSLADGSDGVAGRGRR